MQQHSFQRLAGACLFTVLLLSIGLGLTGSVSVASGPQLSPRAFLPLQFGAHESAPPLHSPFGVSDSIYSIIAQSPQSLNLLVSAGIKHDRAVVFWDVVEPTNTTPENYNWAPVDAALEPLLAQDIEPYVLVYRSPAWAASTDCGPLHDPNDFVELIGALAARFPQVTYWGLYNEVDGAVYSLQHISSGGCFGEDDLDGNGNPDYADYAELMRLAWRAIHNASPNARMSFANLAFDNFTPESQPDDYASVGGCCFNYNFLDNLLSYMQAHPLPPGEKYGDVLGFNNYIYYDIGYWEKKFPHVGIGAKAQALREIQARHGFDFPLVITEMSARATSAPQGVAPESIAPVSPLLRMLAPAPLTAQAVTPEMQARQLAQMYAQLVYYDIQLGMWWTWEDFPDDCAIYPCQLFKYGLADANFTPKPSYFAYKTLIAQLRDFTPTDAVATTKAVNLGFRRGKLQKRFVYAKSDIWGESSPTARFTFAAPRIRVTDMFGASKIYRDNGTGTIKLTVGANPLYVEINP